MQTVRSNGMRKTDNRSDRWEGFRSCYWRTLRMTSETSFDGSFVDEKFGKRSVDEIVT